MTYKEFDKTQIGDLLLLRLTGEFYTTWQSGYYIVISKNREVICTDRGGRSGTDFYRGSLIAETMINLSR
jgi:hypothetical protein